MAEPARKIPALVWKHADHTASFSGPTKNSPMIARDPTAAKPVTHHGSRIAQGRMNRRYGVNSHPVTTPFTAVRTIVPRPTALVATNNARQPTASGACRHRINPAHTIGGLPAAPLRPSY